MRHGSSFVSFKDGGMNSARQERVPILRQVFVFRRSWTDEAPMDGRSIGCPANAYSNLEDPIACFRAILEKMEGGRGPVMLQVRFHGRGRVVATFHLNPVQIPWAYVKHAAKMEQTPRRR